VKVYRIALTKHINDLTGIGARLYGGRWNKKGVGLIYASETRALATVEYLVHMPMPFVPDDLSIATIEISDSIKPKNIKISNLPKNWREDPSPYELAEIGTEWVLSNKSLLLHVPSATVEHEFNILVNPSHPDMKRVKISNIEKYKFNDRLKR
jgi:RES domain-containing protein